MKCICQLSNILSHRWRKYLLKKRWLYRLPGSNAFVCESFPVFKLKKKGGGGSVAEKAKNNYSG